MEGHALPRILHGGQWQALVWQRLGWNNEGSAFHAHYLVCQTSLGETDLRTPYNLEIKLTGDFY